MNPTVSSIGEMNRNIILINANLVFHCSGRDFRVEFSHLGEIRSLIPSKVRIMALTATATKQERLDIIRCLGLRNPTVISVCPSRPNIYYAVRDFISFNDAFGWLLKSIASSTLNGSVIIFCPTISDCMDIYTFSRKNWASRSYFLAMRPTCTSTDA